MAIPDEKAKGAEAIRDLKIEVQGLTTEALPDIEFRHFTPGRTPVTIYAVEDGRPITIPEYQLITVIDKRLEDGRYMFVSDPKDAPEYKLGELLCFLHKDSPERASLDAAGLGGLKFCRKHTLPSTYAKTIHALHRHKQEWGALQDYLKGVKEQGKRDDRRQQLEATLAIARGVAQGSPEAKTPPAVEPDCRACDWQQKPATKNLVAARAAHTREKHPAGEE